MQHVDPNADPRRRHPVLLSVAGIAISMVLLALLGQLVAHESHASASTSDGATSR
jgi:hypothetical protein